MYSRRDRLPSWITRWINPELRGISWFTPSSYGSDHAPDHHVDADSNPDARIHIATSIEFCRPRPRGRRAFPDWADFRRRVGGALVHAAKGPVAIARRTVLSLVRRYFRPGVGWTGVDPRAGWLRWRTDKSAHGYGLASLARNRHRTTCAGRCGPRRTGRPSDETHAARTWFARHPGRGRRRRGSFRRTAHAWRGLFRRLTDRRT